MKAVEKTHKLMRPVVEWSVQDGVKEAVADKRPISISGNHRGRKDPTLGYLFGNYSRYLLEHPILSANDFRVLLTIMSRSHDFNAFKSCEPIAVTSEGENGLRMKDFTSMGLTAKTVRASLEWLQDLELIQTRGSRKDVTYILQPGPWPRLGDSPFKTWRDIRRRSFNTLRISESKLRAAWQCALYTTNGDPIEAADVLLSYGDTAPKDVARPEGGLPTNREYFPIQEGDFPYNESDQCVKFTVKSSPFGARPEVPKNDENTVQDAKSAGSTSRARAVWVDPREKTESLHIT